MSLKNLAAVGLVLLAVAVIAGGFLWYQVRQTEDRLEATETMLATTQSTLEEATESIATANERITSLATLLDQSRVRAEELSANLGRALDDTNELRDANATLTGAIEDSTAENVTLTADLAAAGDREAHLTTKLATEVAAHDGTKSDLASLEVKHVDLETSHARVTKIADEFTSLYGDVQELKNEIGALHEERRPLLLKTERKALACTGSMEPKLTCLDEVTILRNYAPRDITVGTIVVYLGERECVAWHSFGFVLGSELKTCLQYQRPRVIHRVMEIGSQSYLTKGDANRESDGWIPVDDVVGYVIEVHRNVNQENAPLRDAVLAAVEQLDIAEHALDVAKAAWDAKVNEYCGVNTGCKVYYYDETDPIYTVYQMYQQAFDHYKAAFDNYACWHSNAEDSDFPGHIPHSCD